MTSPRAVATCILVLLALLISTAPSSAQPKSRANLSTALNTTALQPGKDAVIAVVVDVEEGLHAQSNKPLSDNLIAFEVKIDANPALTIADPIYPEGEIHEYPALGKLSVYTGRVTVYVPVSMKPDAPAGPLKITGRAIYQICNDKMCFPPERPKFAIDANVVSAGDAVQPNQPELFAKYAGGTTTKPVTQPTTRPNPTPMAAASPTTAPSQVTGNGSDLTAMTAFGMALVAGLLFNVMPCVLPVLPLKAAAFYRAAEHHRSRSVLLGFAFSLGIIAVFALLAVLVLGLRVITWGSLFSNPWFVWPLVILLIACALGLFGAFNITLPTALYGVDPRQDTFGGNVIFGAFTAILATPCTAPLLPPLLLWASAQLWYVGMPAMLMVGVGMALPYLILSAFPEAARKFPQTGPWAELFKQMMGFLLLAAAAYFAGGRLIHGSNFWWLVVAVMAVASLYLVARTVQLSDAARPVGIASTLAVVMLGASLWWTARITGILSGGATSSFIEFTDDGFNSARAAGKPVLVKFTANWCGICQAIEGSVFRDAAVWKALKDREVTVMKVDFSNSEEIPGHDLLLKLNPAGGIPVTAIFPPGSDRPIVLESQYNSDELLAALERATNGAHASAE